MAIYTDMQHVFQSRTLKPRYARVQSTPQAVRLDPSWDPTTADIFPGTVMSRLGDGKVTVCDGVKAPAGLSYNWCAPAYGIDEIRRGGQLDMSMVVMGPDAIWAVYAPAFDTEADWAGAAADLEAGKPVYLKANAKGLLTLEDDQNTQTANSVCRLIGVEGQSCIVVAGLL